MTAIVTTALRELGILRAGSKPRVHIGLTKGDTLWVDAFVDPGHYYHVKLSELISLRDEAAVYTEASAIFGSVVPKPLGYCVRNGWEIFVTDGVAHRPFAPTDLLGPANRRRPIAQAIYRFLATSRAAPAAASSLPDPAALLAALERHFRNELRFAPILERWRSADGLRELEALGCARQHCDLVANNIGVSETGGLVIFDWEDFGKVCLPGLDLCTLYISCLGLEAGVLLAGGCDVLAEQGAKLLIPACDALNIDVSLFWRLVPLYLLIFLYLKQGYATDVRTRIDSLLSRLTSNGSTCGPASEAR